MWACLPRDLTAHATRRALLTTHGFSHRCGPNLQTLEHESLFHKLSQAYLFNSVLVPLLLGMWLSSRDFKLIDQTWYETGGTVSAATLLLIFNYVTPLLKGINPLPILKRSCLGRCGDAARPRSLRQARFAYAHTRCACAWTRCVYSQRQLNELWSPEDFDLSTQCAYTLKTTALGLVYGPIYPLCYLLTAFGLCLSYFMTRCGMRHWYSRPANVNQNMLMKFRRRLGGVVGLSVTVQILATLRALQADGLQAGGIFIVGAPTLVLIYTVTPLGFFKGFARFDQLSCACPEPIRAGVSSHAACAALPSSCAFLCVTLSAEDSEGASLDTDGVSFDDVKSKTGFEAPPYVCPVLRKDPVTGMVTVFASRHIHGAWVGGSGSLPRQENSEVVMGRDVRVSRNLRIHQPGLVARRILGEFGYLADDSKREALGVAQWAVDTALDVAATVEPIRLWVEGMFWGGAPSPGSSMRLSGTTPSTRGSEHSTSKLTADGALLKSALVHSTHQEERGEQADAANYASQAAAATPMRRRSTRRPIVRTGLQVALEVAMSRVHDDAASSVQATQEEISSSGTAMPQIAVEESSRGVPVLPLASATLISATRVAMEDELQPEAVPQIVSADEASAPADTCRMPSTLAARVQRVGNLDAADAPVAESAAGGIATITHVDEDEESEPSYV